MHLKKPPTNQAPRKVDGIHAGSAILYLYSSLYDPYACAGHGGTAGYCMVKVLGMANRINRRGGFPSQ
jgi:hypothetical protein